MNVRIRGPGRDVDDGGFMSSPHVTSFERAGWRTGTFVVHYLKADATRFGDYCEVEESCGFHLRRSTTEHDVHGAKASNARTESTRAAVPVRY